VIIVNAEPKQILVWLAVVVGFFGVALSYFAIYVLAAYFAAGLVWYANLALAISGPIAGGGAIVARKKRQQKLAFVIGLIGFALWGLLWILVLTSGAFRYL
jgi:hypothetical protein